MLWVFPALGKRPESGLFPSPGIEVRLTIVKLPVLKGELPGKVVFFDRVPP
jgi:hypothetical protein